MSQAILTTWREVLSPGDSTWLRFLIEFAKAPVLKVLAIYLRYFRLPIESLLILARSQEDYCFKQYYGESSVWQHQNGQPIWKIILDKHYGTYRLIFYA